jgi:hypothetical protein
MSAPNPESPGPQEDMQEHPVGPGSLQPSNHARKMQGSPASDSFGGGRACCHPSHWSQGVLSESQVCPWALPQAPNPPHVLGLHMIPPQLGESLDRREGTLVQPSESPAGITSEFMSSVAF